MSSTELKRTMSRRLGWLAAGMLTLVVGLPAWALNLNLERSIERSNTESNDIAKTLGHGQRTMYAATRITKRTVRLQLIPRKARAKAG